MLSSVISAVLIVGGLTFLLATMLIFAGRKLYVEEDKRLVEVEDMLPHNNCGACGFPSCHMFAEALVENKVAPSKCSVSSEQEKNNIATFLNVDAGTQTRQVARLACAGGNNVSKVHAEYVGIQSCAAATVVTGGGKSCAWGCLGLADCADACTFDAITMSANGLPVVTQASCTACGDCVVACPKDLFSLQLVEQPLWVACKNVEQGDELLEHCEVACTACGRCAMDAPDHLIKMQNNLPVVQQQSENAWITSKSIRSDLKSSINRCPTGAIIWFGTSGNSEKGTSARRIYRQTPMLAEKT